MAEAATISRERTELRDLQECEPSRAPLSADLLLHDLEMELPPELVAEFDLATEVTGLAVSLEANEVYAQSIRNQRILGRLALRGMQATPEYIGTKAELARDFKTAVEENLATDKELNEHLIFDRMETFGIADGHTVDNTGRPVLDICQEGYRASLKAASHDPEMAIQNLRDAHDVSTVQTVDALEVGEMLAVVSMDPKEELQRNPSVWRDKLHYREGMAVVQVYYKTSECEMLVGAYSVKRSDSAAFRRIFAECGVHVPDGISSHEWILHGLRRRVDEAEARAFGPQIRAAHAREIGRQTSVISVSEAADQHDALLQQYFDTYLVRACEAVASGQNDPVLQSFARALLQTPEHYGRKTLEGLNRIAYGNNFTDADARLIEEKVRYAVVEEIRAAVKAQLDGKSATTPIYEASYDGSVVLTQEQVAALNARSAGTIAGGLSAGRTYGGCTGAGESTDKKEDLGNQDVFGGNAKGEDGEDNDESGACEYVGTFCYCCPYEADGLPAPEPVTVRIVRNANGVARCQRGGCGAALDKDGNVISKGRIYEKAMRRKQSPDN
jgi:hypothetical protein